MVSKTDAERRYVAQLNSVNDFVYKMIVLNLQKKCVFQTSSQPGSSFGFS